MDFILDMDRRLFLFLNGLHAAWLDPIMFHMTRLWLWTPVYLILLWIVLRDYRKQSWIILLAIALTLTLSDQITSHLMKPWFARTRPSHEPGLEGLVHLVNGYRGGMYGFASGHAANTFGIATLFYLLLRPHYPAIIWIFAWAAIMTYTRIYLGVHYPGDILAGAAVGMLCAWGIFKTMRYFTIRYYLTQRLFKSNQSE